MTREEFMDLDDWALYNVYLRPDFNRDSNDDGSKPYWPEPREDKDDAKLEDLTFQEMFFRAWRKHGMAEDEIEARFKVWFKSYQG